MVDWVCQYPEMAWCRRAALTLCSATLFIPEAVLTVRMYGDTSPRYGD